MTDDTKRCYACGETKPIREFMAKYEGMAEPDEYESCNACWVAYCALRALGSHAWLEKGLFTDGRSGTQDSES